MNEIKPKLIRADVLMDHFEKMHKIGILQSIDDIRFAIIDAPEVAAVPIEKIKSSFNKENGTKDKAIIIIDMPQKCSRCQFCKIDENEDGFVVTCIKKLAENPDFYQARGTDPFRRPEWCPLRPLPKQFTTDEILMAKDVKTAIEMRACNDCLEEITGETE